MLCFVLVWTGPPCAVSPPTFSTFSPFSWITLSHLFHLFPHCLILQLFPHFSTTYFLLFKLLPTFPQPFSTLCLSHPRGAQRFNIQRIRDAPTKRNQSSPRMVSNSRQCISFCFNQTKEQRPIVKTVVLHLWETTCCILTHESGRRD